MKPKVSVIIPTYNAGGYIKEAIDSASNQTYKNIEIIVIDDGSTDNTKEVLKSYRDKITYIYKENKGPASARNIGIKRAKGEYIAFLDSDDKWEENKLDVYMKEIENGVGLVGSRANKNGFKKDITYNDLLIENYFTNSSVIAKKECFDKAGLFDEETGFTIAEDWDVWLRIAKIYKVKSIYPSLVKLGTRANSLSSTGNAQKVLGDELKMLKKHFREDNVALKLKLRALSYRYFCASWAYFINKDIRNAAKYIFKSFIYAPWTFFNKKQGGLMARIIIERILRFNIPVNTLTKPFFRVLYGLHIFIREGFSWLVRLIYFEPLFRSQCKSVGKRLWMEKLPYMTGRGEISIGDSVRLSGKQNIHFNSKIFPKPKLTIGNNTFIGHNVSFVVAKEVRIGENCYISGETRIVDNDGHPLDYKKRRENLPPEKEAIKAVAIGKDVWIGRGATILKGVKIGDRAIVGAGAIVTADILSDCVAAGNPARVIKELRKQ